MSRIENAVSGVRYDKDPYYDYRYEPQTIDQCEALVGRPFPDDLRWYLSNVGRLGIEYDHGWLLVGRGEALYLLRFEGADPEVFAKSRYEDYLKRGEGGRLPGDPRHYYPIGKIEGEHNPSVSLRLLVDLNDGDGYGSVWGVRPIGHFDDQTPSEPVRIAEDLAGFLEQIGSERSLRSKAQKNNEALFARLFAGYLSAPEIQATSAPDAQSLLSRFFAHREETVFDGGRNVEFNHHINGRRFETAGEMAETARALATGLVTSPFHGSTDVQRSGIVFGKPEPYGESFASDRLTPGYRTVTVKSSIGEGLTLKETYLLFEAAKGGPWTIVRRLDGKIDDVRIKGVGTFAYDSTYKWHLKKKVTPAWAEFKTELNVDGEEAALTPERIEFIKQIFDKAEFRPVFEEHVYRLYRDRHYPEFEAMDAEEKKDWVKAYPDLAGPSQIWALFGRKASLHVHDGNCFTLHADAGFDPEHGLEMRVENWQIK